MGDDPTVDVVAEQQYNNAQALAKLSLYIKILKINISTVTLVRPI